MKSTKRNSKKSKKVKVKKEVKIVQSYDVWFYNQVKVGKLRLVQKLEIMTFFKEKGLKDIEDPENYNEILKYY